MRYIVEACDDRGWFTWCGWLSVLSLAKAEYLAGRARRLGFLDVRVTPWTIDA